MEKSLIYCKTQGSNIIFGNGKIELVFDGSTGNLRELVHRDKGNLLGENVPSVFVTVNGRIRFTEWHSMAKAVLENAKIIGDNLHLKNLYYSPGQNTLMELFEQDSWEIEQYFKLYQSEPMIKRHLVIRYTGEDHGIVRSAIIKIPYVRATPLSEYMLEAPGYPLPPRFPLDGVPEESWPEIWRKDLTFSPYSIPDHVPGLLAIHNIKDDFSLCVSAFDPIEPSCLQLDRKGEHLDILQTIRCSARLSKGESVICGTQYIIPFAGSWKKALNWYQHQFYEILGFKKLQNIPPYVRGIRIYEVHIGKKVFPGGYSHSPFPTFSELEKGLDRIKDLGFNVIQIMPKEPFPWYTVYDYLDVKTQYGGTPEEFRRFCHRAHQLGIRVILDLVVHGVIDLDGLPKEPPHWMWWDYMFPILAENIERIGFVGTHPYLLSHPEWFCKDEDGQVVKTYTYSFDYGNTSWQDFLIEVCRYYIRELDVDGFRVDAPTWNSFPNWGVKSPRHASDNMLAMHKLLSRIEDAIKAIKSDAIIYCESTGPLWVSCSDCCYNYDENWLLHALIPIVSSRGYAGQKALEIPGKGPVVEAGRGFEAHQAAIWLDERNSVFPQGLVKVHHIDSHDTHEWGGLAMFSREAFGREASHALFVLMACLDGGVMVYTGAEFGDEDFYKKILSLKRDVKAIAEGDISYTAVTCSDPMVFTCLRATETEFAIPVINLQNKRTTFTLQLSKAIKHFDYSATLKDAWSGNLIPIIDGEHVELTLEPYGFAILCVHRI